MLFIGWKNFEQFRKFRNGDKWYGNLLGNLQKIRKLINFQRQTIRLKIPDFLGWKPKGAEILGKKPFGQFGIPRKVVLSGGATEFPENAVPFATGNFWKFISEFFIACLNFRL